MMEVHAIEVPSKQHKEGAFMLVMPYVPIRFLPYAIGRGGYHLLETIAGKLYKFVEIAQGEDSHMTIFTNDPSYHEESIKDGIKITAFRGTKIQSAIIEALANYDFSIQAGHWWLKYGLPIMMLANMPIMGYCWLSWVDLLLAIYLMRGKQYLLENALHKEFTEYMDQVKEGIDKSLKDPASIEMIIDHGLQAIQEGIDQFSNVADAYTWAIHNCRKYGWPELSRWYIKNAGYDEWRKQEVGVSFRVYDKAPIEGKTDYTRKHLTYPVNKEDLYKEVFHV